jgi:hypothetical protein
MTMTMQSYTASSENPFACSTTKTQEKEIGMFVMEDTEAETFARECIQDLEQMELRLFGKTAHPSRDISRGNIQERIQLEHELLGKASADRHYGVNFDVFIDPEFRCLGNVWANYWVRETLLTAAQNDEEDIMDYKVDHQWGAEHEERFTFEEAETHREIHLSELLSLANDGGIGVLGNVGYSNEIEGEATYNGREGIIQ